MTLYVIIGFVSPLEINIHRIHPSLNIYYSLCQKHFNKLAQYTHQMMFSFFPFAQANFEQFIISLNQSLLGSSSGIGLVVFRSLSPDIHVGLVVFGRIKVQHRACGFCQTQGLTQDIWFLVASSSGIGLVVFGRLKLWHFFGLWFLASSSTGIGLVVFGRLQLWHSACSFWQAGALAYILCMMSGF